MYLNAGKYKTRGKNDGLQNLQEKKVFPETSVHHWWFRSASAAKIAVNPFHLMSMLWGCFTLLQNGAARIYC